MKKKAKVKAAEVKAVKVKTEDSGKKKEDGPEKSERVSKEETDSTREMLKTIVASLNQADAAKLLRRANLLEQASADFHFLSPRADYYLLKNDSLLLLLQFK